MVLLAARVNRSPRQFFRIFLREYGVSPARMVDRLRVEAARWRLEETSQGLSAIVSACGFGTEETMRRAFIKHVGASPGAYRDRFCRSSEMTEKHGVAQ
jgi:transcriptional regulator GlxA family with amidase domain